MMQKEPPKLSKVLFWDTNFEKVDYDRYPRDVISRVVMRGNWNDWQEIKKYYGLEKIKEEMLKVRYLDKKSLSFLSSYFNTPKENFRCYTLRQFTQPHWDF